MIGKRLLIVILIGFITTGTSQTPPVIFVAGDGSGDYNCNGIIESNNIDFSTLKTGLYYLRIIENETGEVRVAKVLKT